MLVAEAPGIEETFVIIDADVTFTLPQHPLVHREILALWDNVKPLLDSPDIDRIDVWAPRGYMERSTTVGFLLHLGEVGRQVGKFVRVRTVQLGSVQEP